MHLGFTEPRPTIPVRPVIDFSRTPSKAMTRLAAVAALFWLSLVPAPAAGETVSVITVDGAIGPATASYVSRAVDEAALRNSQCLIIRLNTPGGLLDSMEKIVQKLLGSPIPVVGVRFSNRRDGSERRLFYYLSCGYCGDGAGYYDRRGTSRVVRVYWQPG